MTAGARVLEPESIGAAACRVIAHPWQTFVRDWNWKAALLSALFRAMLFSAATLRGPGAMRGVWIELLFRLAIGGFWESLLQAFRRARPAWLAGLCVTLLLPGAAHTLEFLALTAGHTAHIVTDCVDRRQRRIATGQLASHAQRPAAGRRWIGAPARRPAASARSAPRHVRRAARVSVKTMHVTNCWHSESGGIATFYRELLRSAERLARPIRLVVPGPDYREEKHGEYGKIYHVPGEPSRLSPGYWVIMPKSYLLPHSPLRRILAQERPDLWNAATSTRSTIWRRCCAGAGSCAAATAPRWWL